MKRQSNSRPVLTALKRIASLSLQYISKTLKEHSIIETNIDQTSKEEIMSLDKASIETAIVLSSHSYIKTKHLKYPIINYL